MAEHTTREWLQGPNTHGRSEAGRLLGLGVVKYGKRFAVALAAATSLVLVACGSDVTGDQLEESMGNATPDPSPQAADPAGTVFPFDAIEDLDTTDGVIAVRTANALTVGTLDQLRDGSAAAHPLSGECGDVSANAGTFALGCGTSIMLVRADDPGQADTLDVDERVTSATVTSSGDVLAGSNSERDVWLYRDGELADTFSVARETDQLQAVPVDGQADSVVRTNRFDTTVQDIDWGNGRQGGTLRAGLGVGKIAAGANGLLLAADATGDQLLVYTTDDIIRLHQMAPVPESPWDAAWDNSNQVAWVTSTATNTATGYDISRGVPLQRGELATVGDAQSIATLDDATLLIASASGGGLQVVEPDELHLDELPAATAAADAPTQQSPSSQHNEG